MAKKLNRVTASTTTDFIFVASLTTIHGYRLLRGRDYELGRINDSNDEFTSLRNTAPSQCHLQQILDGPPDIILGCRFTGLAITCIRCGIAQVDGIEQEHLVAACEDGMVYVWRLGMSTEEILTHRPLEINNDTSTWSIALSSKHDRLAVGANNHRIRVYNLSTGLLIYDIAHHQHNIPYLSFSPCGNYLISASIDCSCSVFDASNGQIVTKYGLAKDSMVGEEDHAHWVWGAMMIDLSSIEDDITEHRMITRGLRERREFWNEPTDLALLSCEDEYYQHFALYPDEIPDELSDSDMEFDQEHMNDFIRIHESADEEDPGVVEWRQGVQDVFNVVDAAMLEATSPWETPRNHFASTENITFFHRIANGTVVSDDPPVDLACVFEIRFPKCSLITLAMTVSELILFDFDSDNPEPAQILRIDSLLSRAFEEPGRNVNRHLPERFVFLFWLPEFSALLVGNQIGRLILLHFTRVTSSKLQMADESDLLRISAVGFPCPDDTGYGSLLGMDVRKVDTGSSGLYYEVFCFYAMGTIRLFRVSRIRSLEPVISLCNM